MKRLFLLLILALTLGCSAESAKEKANAALIEKYIEAVENLDYQIMEEILDDDYLGMGPSHNDSIDKTGAISNWKKNVENLYEKIDYNKLKILPVTITAGENKGEWISAWAELSITYQEEGRQATIMSNTIYQIANDKIVKSYTFYNEADVLEQLGYVFIDPNDL